MQTKRKKIVLALQSWKMRSRHNEEHRFEISKMPTRHFPKYLAKINMHEEE